MKKTMWIILGIFLFLFISCKKKADHVTVQHILIAFKGSIPKDSVRRTQFEAELLVKEIFMRAKEGQDFDKLVKNFSDDQYPGIYRMSNFNVEPDESEGEYPRSKMVEAFGDLSFRLSVDQIGLAKYDPETCKYGWHIIKRIE
jgi:parvulin-like peptidyl-prolyl isomerase